MKTFQSKLIVGVVFYLFFFHAKAQVIPDSLRVDWSTAGYTGTIPSPSLIINVKDFGAYGDSIHDDYNAIMSAINSSSNLRVIFFPAGNYLIKSPIALSSNVVMRGEGTTSNLIFNFINGDCIDVISNQTNSFSNIISGYAKGSNFLKVSNVSSIHVNDYAEIREANGSWDVAPASWAKFCVGQIVKIKAIHNDTLIIEPSLRINYTDSLQPQIRSISPKQNVGIECLKITRIDSPRNTYGNNIDFTFAENCWVTGVESNKSQGSHILLSTSGHITISGCYFHDAFTYDGTGTSGYGVTTISHTSDCKVENSIFKHLRHSMVAKQGANGNVFGYNYSLDPNRTEIPNDAGGDMLLHGHYAFSNLFEGNIGQNIFIDDYWGPAGPFNTFFRNRAELYGIIIIDQYNYPVKSDRQNYVGNEVTDTDPNKGNYLLTGSNHFTYGNNIKGIIQPPGTILLTDSSYYLSSRPYFWNDSSLLWPSIGIPNVINTGTNPAKERYLSDSIVTSCIKEPGKSFSIIASADSISCNGGTTSINITPSGGSEPYQYSIDGINYQTQNSFVVSSGNYTITTIDANSDTAITTINVTQPLRLTATATKTMVNCNGDSSGAITVKSKGGTSPSKYSLNGGAYQSSNIFSNLKAGTYSTSVLDARGCTFIVSNIKITQPAALKITTTATATSCKTATDGSITVTASKGTSPYQYSLNGGTYQSGNAFSNLAAGTYSVTVKDANNCTLTKTGIKVKKSTNSCSPIAFADNKKNNDFNNAKLSAKIYPNPSTSNFTLRIDEKSNQSVAIKVTNMFGKEIYSANGSVNQSYYFGENFAPGIYIVQIIQNKNLQTLKIVKQ